MKNKTTHFSRRGVISSIVGLWLCFFSLSAQTMQDTVMASFSLMEKIPQEKLYLHLDKPFYGAGEKIWFKGYLLNAVTHQDSVQSNFIITELIDRADSIVERKKIRRDSLVFANAFRLPPALPAGDYHLRGYSNWMLNQDPDFFYSRNLKIGNAIDNSILSSIEYQQEDDTHYTGKMKFYGNGTELYSNTNVRYRYLENGKVKDKGKRKTDEGGWISISLPDLKPIATRSIEVEFDDPQYSYKRTFHMPPFSKEFDVTFFPEGGALLDVPHQNVAFKVQGADGYSKKVEGILLDQLGDTLSSFRSEHDGMGVFTLNPTAGNSYYATITSSDGITKRFNLPAVESQGITLSMTHYKQEIRFEVQKTEATEWPQKLLLLAHTRGKLSVLQPIQREKPYGKMNDSLFLAGITHFMLIDQRGNVVSERLVFVPELAPHQWEIKTDKPSYGKREKVSLQVSAKDVKGAPVEGSFSLCVTDHRSIQPDSLADNILSNLLLTSDLKGSIEDPGFYFIKQNARTLRALDFLMLTHGWRRHQIKNVLQAPTMNLSNYIEKGQTISGRIKGFFGGNVKKGPIFVLAPRHNIFSSTTTDENGGFIVNTNFKDSTNFVIQARTKKGFAGVDIEIDTPSYPAPSHKLPFRDGAAVFMDDYLLSARDQYYMEGGMRVYNLKEVVVNANRIKASSESIYTGGINTYTLEGEKLEQYGAQTALDVVRRLPGVNIIYGNEVHIRNNPDPPLIVIDDVVYEDDNDILTMLPASNLSSLSLLRGADAALLGARGSAGAIVITLKDPKNLPAKPARGIITYSPLGYSDAVEFYQPTYDTPEKKSTRRSDLRTTIHWHPELKLDAQGTATVEYYTSDSTAPQDIIIEGVDKNGKVCRWVQTINK